MGFEDFLSQFEKAKNSGQAFAVVTFVHHMGSAPQEMGSRLIVTSQGYFAGTVGGGKLEKAAIEQAQKFILEHKQPAYFVQWNLQKDLGMSCGGVVSLFFEIHHPASAWPIVIFGAGHVAQELVRVLLRLECQITCYDTRAEWIEKLPQDRKLKTILSDNLADEVAKLSSKSFVVVCTMGHATDLPVLEKILKDREFPYIGAIGSDVKALKLRKNLSALGVSEKQAHAFFCPMGEEFGNNTPEEIAISITAQLLKVRDQLNKA